MDVKLMKTDEVKPHEGNARVNDAGGQTAR